MSEWLFSYGTLQNQRTQIDLFGRRLHGVADALQGYTLTNIDIVDEKFLAKGENKQQKSLVFTNRYSDRVVGMALEISDHELLIADQYEPSNYKRAQVNLQSGRRAWVYVSQ